jgi:hypothetical protein
MARRLLAGREPIGDDVLRQRRDLYAVALGLLLFQVAHGTIDAGGSLGNPYSMKFANPCWFIWAAWIAFGYFFVRFRMFAPDNIVRMWQEEIMLQAGDCRGVRKIAAEHCNGYQDHPTETIADVVKNPAGPIPTLRFHKLRLYIAYPFGATGNLFGTTSARAPKMGTSIVGNDSGTWGQRARLWIAVVAAVFTSMSRERTFTDYVLPYVVALITVTTAVIYFWAGKTEICCISFAQSAWAHERLTPWPWSSR